MHGSRGFALQLSDTSGTCSCSARLVKQPWRLCLGAGRKKKKKSPTRMMCFFHLHNVVAILQLNISVFQTMWSLTLTTPWWEHVVHLWNPSGKTNKRYCRLITVVLDVSVMSELMTASSDWTLAPTRHRDVSCWKNMRYWKWSCQDREEEEHEAGEPGGNSHTGTTNSLNQGSNHRPFRCKAKELISVPPCDYCLTNSLGWIIINVTFLLSGQQNFYSNLFILMKFRSFSSSVNPPSLWVDYF